MKRFIISFILIAALILEIVFIDDIKVSVSKLINNHPDIIIQPSNDYKKDYDFMYIKQVNNFIPYSIGDLKNIFYTIINNGWDDFTFYCPSEYETCIKDVQEFSNDDVLLTTINNYASPFNSFISIQTTFDDSGEVNIKINKLYDQEKINKINQEVDKIINENIKDTMTDKEKIKTIHDYIINKTEYDKERNEKGTSEYSSNTAYGPLFEGKAICSGYADVMALFLNKFGIKNYKIASKTHIWNAVLLDDQWLHLDLTWDDPVSNYGPILDYDFFLVKSQDLISDDEEINEYHRFNPLIYLEFN